MTEATSSFDSIVREIVNVRDGLRIIRLSVPENESFSYLAGQYVDLTFSGFPTRSYSLANAPENGVLEIHIKDSGHGGASSYATHELKKGETVRVCGPFGRNVFKPHNTGPLLALAGGMGIAPLKAIVEDALRHGRTQPVTLYWGTVHSAEQYMGDYFRDLAKKHESFHFISMEGRPVGESAVRDFDTLAGYSIYMAGPPAMIRETIPLLLEKGAAADSIHHDYVEVEKMRIAETEKKKVTTL